ncbi:MAG: protoporphyrinogen oxidase [Candidatus Promineifilaceae bacterium]
MNNSFVDVAIVGGGIAGLSAAWFLQQEAPGLSYALLESGDRWGGKIKTETVDGPGGEPFVIEGGPDSYITTKPWAWQLTQKLGMDEDVLGTNDARRKTFVLNKGKPTPLPDGVMLIVPTRFTPFALSPLISPWGKLRMGMDLFIPPLKDGRDETLAQFIERRLGREALDKIAEPLMSGIYNADAEMQSLLATFPRFRDIESQHGSLIRGMLASKRARSNGKAALSPSSNGHGPSAAKRPPSAFVSYKSGMERLVDRLLEDLDGDLCLNTAVSGMSKTLDGRYELNIPGGILKATAVILAVPAYAAANIVQILAPEAAEELRKIRYVSTGTISLAYRRDELDHPLDGFGIVIPRSERRRINAITWSSTKFDHRAPQGTALLRVFFGGSRTPEMFDKGDEELETIVGEELRQLMGIEAEPLFHRIYRWPKANPQYDVNHLTRVAAIEEALPPGVFVSGSPYRGIGVPDCVHQGQQAGEAAELYVGEQVAV